MKYYEIEGRSGHTDVINYHQEFSSLNEFHDYIMDMPVNNAFKNETRKSEVTNVEGRIFTGTNNLREALSLFRNGWDEGARKLNQMVKVGELKLADVKKTKNVQQVAGYHPIVPAYLNGLPNSMVAKKQVMIKEKVVTLTKNISYSHGVKQETIFEESRKALSIINKIEQQGVRVNLNAVMAAYEHGWKLYRMYMLVRLKSATERLNVSKMAFPLVHPSMLRRLGLRWEEVFPQTNDLFVSGYGKTIKHEDICEAYPDHIVIPNFLSDGWENIKSLEDLKSFVGSSY